MQLTFVDKFTNEQLIHLDTIHYANPIDGKAFRYYFMPDAGQTETPDWEPWALGLGRDVRCSDSPLVYKAGIAAITIASISLGAAQPEAAVVLGLIGISLTLGTSPDSLGNITPDSPYVADSDDIKHVRTFSDAVSAQLAGLSDAGKLRILAPIMQWQCEYMAEESVEVYTRDSYDVTGFTGTITHEVDKPIQNQVYSQVKRFTYQANL